MTSFSVGVEKQGGVVGECSGEVAGRARGAEVAVRWGTGSSPCSERLDLLIFDLLHLVRDLGDDKVLRAQLPDGVDQGVQAPGVFGQGVQQRGRPLGLRGPAADLLGVVPRQDPARAQVVEVALGPDLVAEVVPQSGQHVFFNLCHLVFSEVRNIHPSHPQGGNPGVPG